MMEGFLEGVVLALTLQALAMIVPGQNHFLILSVSRAGLLKTMLAVAGIASAGAVYSSGASAVAFLSGKAMDFRFFALLGFVGCSYLIYIGIKNVLHGLRLFAKRKWESSQDTPTVGSAFLSGFLVNLSNAKSLLFFGSIFSTALPLANMSPSMHFLAVSLFFSIPRLFTGAWQCCYRFQNFNNSRKSGKIRFYCYQEQYLFFSRSFLWQIYYLNSYNFKHANLEAETLRNCSGQRRMRFPASRSGSND